MLAVQHTALDLDVELLEPLLRQMVELIGLPGTMTIVQQYGGTLLYIPRQADENPHLLRMIGVEKAGILGRALGPDKRLIPSAKPALIAARNRQILADLQTLSLRQVARRYHLGERQVWYIKAQAQAQAGGAVAEPGLFD
jgi:hypothetical protein